MTSPSRADRFATALRAFFVGDLDTFLDLYDERSVHTFPFAPPTMPSRVVGRTDIDRWMRSVSDIVTFGDGIHDVTVREGADFVTAEWKALGHFPDGSSREISYVAVVTLDGDVVREYREYITPLDLQPAGRSPRTIRA